ncbi:MAG TPA: hypothetical protein VG603_14600 [Chitinophagales bacterium]|nr:hypothetical protein [Chitinophagales bacterium]
MLITQGSGIVTMGATSPAAQVDIMKNLSPSLGINYLLHVGSVYTSGLPNSFFAVRDNGYVGIGVFNDGAALTEIGDAQNFGASGTPQFMIDNGAYGTGSYVPYFIVRNKTAGVGIDPNTNSSTFAIAGTDATVIDIYEQAGSGRDGKIQFRNSAGSLRHYISDDLTTNNLVIHTGSGGSANSTLTVEGKEEVTTGLDLTGTDPGSGGWYNQLRFSDNTGAVQQIICNAGNDLIMSLNPLGNGSGMLKIAGNVQIGDVTTPCASGSCYSLYVEKGILAERYKCALKSTSDWSDYVFNGNYNLMDMDSLERFIIKNKHLPNVPSAEEVYKNGIDLGNMDAKLLEKIEELSLYVIELQKEINSLKVCHD